MTSPSVAQPKKLEISPEDLLKVQRAREKNEAKTKVNSTWLFIAEFGYYFGWCGIEAIRNNDISLKEADLLLCGARKVWNGKLYDHASAAFIGAASAQTKAPVKTFGTATRELIKQTKADA